MNNFDNIPVELRDYPHWTPWKRETRDGKQTKVLYNVHTGRRGKPNDKSTFAPFDVGFVQIGKYDGLGIGVFEDSPPGEIGVLDIDKCFVNGELIELAQEIISVMNSYTEISPSDKGIRIVFTCRGFNFDKLRYFINNRKIGVECYISGATNHFVTITGNVFGGILPVGDRSNEIRAVLEKYMLRSSGISMTPAYFEAAPRESSLKDEEVLEKAFCNPKNGDKFSRLWNGDTSDHAGDDSAADLAFCNYLNPLCGGDRKQMDSIFRKSGLMREKWDTRHGTMTYGEMTLLKAAPLSEFINPQTNAFRYRFNERGNGDLFADSLKSYLRFCPGKRNNWMLFNGSIWVIDEGNCLVHERAKAFSDYLFSIKPQLTELSDKEVKNIFELTKVAKRKSLIEDAKSVHPLLITNMDAIPDLFNCLNGTLNLNTGYFRPHDPNDMLTKIAPVEYLPDADAPLWKKTLQEVFPKKPEVVRYLQKILGYTMTGKPIEEQFFILFGATTRNGKGTIVSTIIHLLGSYAVTAQPELLAMKQYKSSSAPRDDLARLHGARFVSINEPPKGMQLDEALVKTMTGRDMITARKLHESGFDFTPQFSLVMNTNHLPYVSDHSLFSSGRVVIIPFERHFKESEQDKALKDKLRQPLELSGILNWLLEGLRLYRAEGLKQPKEVKEAIAAYMLDSDKVQRFLNDRTEQSTGAESTSELFFAFKEWCISNNFEAGSIATYDNVQLPKTIENMG